MKYSEIKDNAAKIATLETAIAEGYRALQSKLKDFEEKKIVYLQVKLNASFAVLKAEAKRIIESYRPIAEIQNVTEVAAESASEVLQIKEFTVAESLASANEVELSPEVEFVDAPEFRADGTEIELSPEVEFESAPGEATESEQVEITLERIKGLTPAQHANIELAKVTVKSWLAAKNALRQWIETFTNPDGTNIGSGAVEISPALQVHLINDAELDKQIAVYVPHDHIPTKLAIVSLKAHYVSDDRSWRLPVSMLSEVVKAFSEGNYQYSEVFKKAVTPAITPPQVDLLREEHPERCIVVSGFTDADEYFKCKVSHLDGVYNESDNTWRFCLDTLPLLLAYFPSPDYTHSETLLNEFKPIECGF